MTSDVSRRVCEVKASRHLQLHKPEQRNSRARITLELRRHRDVETLPDLGTLTDAQVTWRDLAVWASDYDNARFVDMSSPTPTDNGDGTYSYPDRQLNAIARCTNNGTPAFERIANVRLPGWTVRGVAGFSETGVVTFATTLGLTQAYR